MGAFTTIAVNNTGGFVCSFFLKAVADGEAWSVESGNYPAPNVHTVQIPVDATSITLSVHGEGFTGWKHLHDQTWDDTSGWNTSGLAFLVYGTAGDMKCSETQ